MLLCLILLATTASTDSVHDLRVKKAHIIVDNLYPNSGFSPYCGYLVTKHEERNNEEFAGDYWWSLVYSGANFSLRVHATSEGLCSGPCDVKSTSLAMHRRMTNDPMANISHHVAEMWLGYTRGYRGIGLCMYTMLPASPRDWGGGMFRRTNIRHRDAINSAYKKGLLP